MKKCIVLFLTVLFIGSICCLSAFAQGSIILDGYDQIIEINYTDDPDDQFETFTIECRWRSGGVSSWTTLDSWNSGDDYHYFVIPDYIQDAVKTYGYPAVFRVIGYTPLDSVVSNTYTYSNFYTYTPPELSRGAYDFLTWTKGADNGTNYTVNIYVGSTDANALDSSYTLNAVTRYFTIPHSYFAFSTEYPEDDLYIQIDQLVGGVHVLSNFVKIDSLTSSFADFTVSTDTSLVDPTSEGADILFRGVSNSKVYTYAFSILAFIIPSGVAMFVLKRF